MSNSPDFIQASRPANGFLDDIKTAARSCGQFLVHQAPINLVFLAIYAGLLIWDYHSMDLTHVATPSDWNEKIFDWFPGLVKITQVELNMVETMTWRGKTANFISTIYWLTALLFMVNRSRVFAERGVSGIVPYIFRITGILILLVIPVVVGLGLLIVPGYFLFMVGAVASAIAVFKDQSSVTSIRLAYRMLRFSRAERPRFLALSPIAAPIAGFILIDFLLGFGSTALVYGIHAVATQQAPEHARALSLIGSHMRSLISSLISLILHVYILQFYAEFEQARRAEAAAIELAVV